MITVQVIQGRRALDKYEETGKIPSKKWLSENSCIVLEKTFHSQEVYYAYIEGLGDADGWETTHTLNPVITPDPDCSHCQQWRSYFSDRETTTYCPDCSKEIITPVTYDTISFNGQEYQVRRVDIPGYRDNAIIAGDDLCFVLIKDNEPTSDEAGQLDEEIIFYVQSDKLRLSDEELIKHVMKNIG